MNLWLLIAAALIAQEFASAAIVLSLALQSHLPLWPIHIIWAAATLGDMYAGYWIGTWVKENFHENRIVKRLEEWLTKIFDFFGKYGRSFGLLVLGSFNFPYLNAFIASWLGFRKNAAFALTFAGDAIWYAALWGTVLGVKSITSNPALIVLIIVTIGIASRFIFKFIEDRA